MKRGEFKGWVTGTYQKYLYEHDAYNEHAKPLLYYWQEYKWWLRQQFRLEQIKEKRRREYNEKLNTRQS